ncbi:hypothetical protein [Almyronema epifaneia]|uniref:Uncharacterized protein n=1 Tax=Almyronema epifaneia S1 TaxID=2991925 RepID=A0ABW6II45_9CYAN
METATLVQISAFTDWIIGVSHVQNLGYQCWVINPELDLLSDGAVYHTSLAAMTAGRTFVERSR